jgi:uncharacterized protein YjbI with pentapeptide repeats
MFINCDLSLAKIRPVVFCDVQLKDCKMLGLQFDTANEYGLNFSFDHCTLDNSSFTNTKIKSTLFQHSQLREVDFTNCDLSESTFLQCDLHHAIFDSSNLEKVDFRTSFHYSIDPQRNKLKKSMHAYPALLGLLDHIELIIE